MQVLAAMPALLAMPPMLALLTNMKIFAAPLFEKTYHRAPNTVFGCFWHKRMFKNSHSRKKPEAGGRFPEAFLEAISEAKMLPATLS